jgi:hypothetical protein
MNETSSLGRLLSACFITIALAGGSVGAGRAAAVLTRTEATCERSTFVDPVAGQVYCDNSDRCESLAPGPCAAQSAYVSGSGWFSYCTCSQYLPMDGGAPPKETCHSFLHSSVGGGWHTDCTAGSNDCTEHQNCREIPEGWCNCDP